MALSRSILRASVTSGRTPAKSIGQANRLICADSVNSMFVTLFYAQLDLRTGELTYVNAGHNPPLLYRCQQGELIELSRTGIPLGLFESAEFEQRSVRLQPGDFVVLYTDGLSEAMDMEHCMFGEERLRRILLEQRDAGAEDMAEALEQALNAFAGETPPSDDVTLVIARRV
jgi:sigma-B regulation protein RsbU (phosphoserine phosphatase)